MIDNETTIEKFDEGEELEIPSFNDHVEGLNSAQAKLSEKEKATISEDIENASFSEHVEALNATQTQIEKKERDSSGALWYVLHTYSGYESMVQENLHLVFGKNNMSDRLFETLVPMEDVVEEKGGKRKIVKRRKFPCYVIVKMVYDNTMWHMITNTRGVTGFVGPGGRPIPLTPAEVARMNLEQVVIESDITVGELVKVLEGPLAGHTGTVEKIDPVTSKLKVVVSMFGRPTPVDLEMYQVERVQ